MNRDSNLPESVNPFNEQPGTVGSAPFPSFTPQPYQPLSHGNGPASLHNEPREFIPPEHSPLPQKQNGGSLPPLQPDVPLKLGLNIGHDDGNLGIEFRSGVNSAPGEFEMNDGSELPWVCPESPSA